jgi:hypothetical protein
MNFALKIIGLFLLSLPFASAIYAKAIKQPEFNFKVDAQKLIAGDFHYSFHLVTPRKLMERIPMAADLDSLSLLQENDVKIMLTKTAFVINKPVGFFDNEHIRNEKIVSHMMGEQSITSLDQVTYKVSVPGEMKHSYKMRSYFDSDDISTLPNSRIIQAVSAAKKMDVLSQSSSSMVLKEYTHYTDYLTGGVKISSYITLQEGSTLVITYGLSAVKKAYAKDLMLEGGFVEETEAIKSLLNSYQEK